MASPGGWRILGNTPVELFNPKHTAAGGTDGGGSSAPSLLRPCDRLRFVPCVDAVEARNKAVEWGLPLAAAEEAGEVEEESAI